MGNSFRSILVLIAIAAGTPHLLTACSASQADSKKEVRPAVPVAVAPVVQKTLPVQIRSTGVAEAYTTVLVKSRVSGQIIEVGFKDGQDVKEGDLLFRIDPRPLEAQLQQMIANQARNEAQLQQAIANQVKAEATISQSKANYNRDAAQLQFANSQRQSYDQLYAQGAISRTQAEQFQNNANTSQSNVNASDSAIIVSSAAAASTKADIEAAKANLAAGAALIENAQIQLSYTQIYSPINGRVSSIKVNQGNLVKADDTVPLVTISQIRPIYVTFTIPERALSQVKQYQKNGQLRVEAFLPNDKRPVTGSLTFIDSLVDATTGTVQLKATFANNDDRLAPGQRMDVMLQLTEETNAITVPIAALQTGQKGQFVYVLKSDHTVELRPVQVSNTVGSDAAIKEGLAIGEQVVIDGQFNLAPNAKVEVKDPVTPNKSGEKATDKAPDK